MTSLRSLAITLFALILALPATPLFAADDDTLIIYSGRSDKFVKPILQQFTKQTGIKTLLHSAESTSLINKMRLEGKRTKADLFLSNDAGNLQIGSDLGLFAPISEKIMSNVDKNMRAPDNTWLGLSARARVLVISTERHDADFVKSVFDLADPRLKNRLAITYSSNESFIAGATVYMQSHGKKAVLNWLKGMKKNIGNEAFNKHSKIVAAVASGKKSVGLVNHYYIYRHLDKHPDAAIRIVMPDQGADDMGVAWNVAGIAINRHSNKKAKAEKLLAFLISEQGQKMFANSNREYPVLNGVAAAAVIPAVGSYKVADIPMHELGRQRNATIDLIEEVGMP